MNRLRTGITTGACAAAAAGAASLVLSGRPAPREVALALPAGQKVFVPVLYARLAENGTQATAAVRKDAGDDPDVTHGLEVVVSLWPSPGPDHVFLAGEGVGTVTKPGLQIPPGQPAINPGPRGMIAAAIAEVTDQPMCVEVAIPGGKEIAAQTFNPRLGIVGGLSILGTTGIVRPYCRKALRDSLRCSLDVAAACGVRHPVLVPGNIGAKAAGAHFRLADQQMIEVSNEWGFMVSILTSHPFAAVMVVGHPGKLTKLAKGNWDTHSARSDSPVPLVQDLAGRFLKGLAPQVPTTEGVFAALEPQVRRRVADELAGIVRRAMSEKIAQALPVAVMLCNMAGEELGRDGDFTPWL